jgi:FHA domain-containing protein
MILTLRAVSLNDQPLTRPITARFDAAGGTIGRADHSTLALPDPERFISRKQAEIVFLNGGYLIRNVGAANPIGLGKRTLANGESAMLGDGDDVRIGGYLLRAECSTVAAPVPAEATLDRLVRSAAPPPVVAAPAPPAPTPAPLVAPVAPLAPPPAAAPSDNPFADLLGGGDDLMAPPGPAAVVAGPAAADPFADLLGGPPAAAALPPAASPAAAGGLFDDLLPPAAGLSAGSAAVRPPPPPAARLPDDFDPFASIAAPPAPRGALHDDPFAALAPVAPAPTLDQQFGLVGGGGDPLKDFEFDLGTLGGTGGGAPAAGTDPLAMFDLASASPASPAPQAPPPMADHLDAVHAAFEPPRVAAPPPPAAAPAMTPAPHPAAAPAAGSGGSAEALWQAFCQGAGVSLPLPADPAQAAARMHQVGLVMRAAVEGTRELMAVRASTKYEMRATVTQIMARSNNPLKFAPDTRTGVEQLVQPATRGFLEGPAAMDDAMRDLVGHSIGTVAGMRAAIEGMLDRFDPAALEKTLGAGSMLDNLVPASRKARLWELYLQRFRGIKEEAQEDFHALFGKAFVAAYEQQVARLKQGGKGS